ncbi:putative Response regulator receiver protein [Planktothrix serta PCC 8927]|uniref:Response regulator receiver protein n=1 Tax=Planktothrix serta PCC 8927 TaxID=671068 RepID=A0A7Z9BXP8_9CYAN|nr:response regulator [Planktothrix serta]VXD23081.1 putative Response regulator receiver protein [Planktothrix serta PCC 8927]
MYKILIIEKDFFLLEILSEWIISVGFFPLKANTLHQGFELLHRDNPDLILCNYKLPDGNGLEFLQKIKLDVKTRNIPFVLIAGAELKPFKDWQVDYLPNSVLYKPFWPQMLLETLHLYLPNSSDINLLCI